jgi:hypothetical protein
LARAKNRTTIGSSFAKSLKHTVSLTHLRVGTPEGKAEGVALVELVGEVVEGEERIRFVSHLPQLLEEGVVVILQQMVEVIFSSFHQHFTLCRICLSNLKLSVKFYSFTVCTILQSVSGI